eukprot:GEZU01039899.1.p1 GENE.GEZU01039899.1~~GEZU01039899.1.p1  ORF type:complete len:169 (+),score=34.29 GEZU01039899.1:595-1101(+)
MSDYGPTIIQPMVSYATRGQTSQLKVGNFSIRLDRTTRTTQQYDNIVAPVPRKACMSPDFSLQQRRQSLTTEIPLSNSPDAGLRASQELQQILANHNDSAVESAAEELSRITCASPIIRPDSIKWESFTPPKRTENPLAFDKSFYNTQDWSPIGAELGLFTFSPPPRE